MKRQSWAAWILAFAFSLSLVSCGSKDDDKAVVPAAATTTTTTTLKFADVETIIKTSCGTGTNCHVGTYDSVAEVKAAKSEISDRVNSTVANKVMPKDELDFKSTADGKKLIEWLAGGEDLK